MSLSFVLHAKNSSGHQMLDIERVPDGTYGFTLYGHLDGKSIQVDFDSLTQRDMDDLVAFISLRLKQQEGATP
jgi:hypothetical protein